ncbi:MAG: hypothetical protein LWW79_02760 [Holophagaceae bacterium]|nr:hypothetical protein [Holophagaceae bacterium]
MTRFIRTLVAMLFGGSLLMAQLPNPLNLPDPLGLSRKPEPSRPAPRPAPREGRRAERPPRREKHRDQGKHKGQQKRQNRARGEHPGHDRR